MISKKEMIIIPATIIIISLAASLSLNFSNISEIFLGTLLATTIVILSNIFVKKFVAYNLDSEIEMKIWEAGKYGFDKDRHSKKSFPMGAVLPIISKIALFPFNSFVWMASLVFDVRPRVFRGARRFGLYTFSDVTEYHIGLIAAAGIVINLLLAIAGYFLGFPLFARLNMYYAFFSILPFSELDGNKIFFGNLIMWCFLAALILIGMLFAIFVI